MTDKVELENIFLKKIENGNIAVTGKIKNGTDKDLIGFNLQGIAKNEKGNPVKIFGKTKFTIAISDVRIPAHSESELDEIDLNKETVRSIDVDIVNPNFDNLQKDQITQSQTINNSNCSPQKSKSNSILIFFIVIVIILIGILASLFIPVKYDVEKTVDYSKCQDFIPTYSQRTCPNEKNVLIHTITDIYKIKIIWEENQSSKNTSDSATSLGQTSIDSDKMPNSNPKKNNEKIYVTNETDYAIVVRREPQNSITAQVSPSDVSDPSKNVLLYITKGDTSIKLIYQNEKKVNNGRTWLKVKIPDGSIGWVYDQVVRTD
ncbi:MAG: hypothetical protein LBM13_06270 [Candidatus Ancillula sp.]|jgi:hypothetical protein|nr:hypothetical protein [Candidatus Ancillula sp.]